MLEYTCTVEHTGKLSLTKKSKLNQSDAPKFKTKKKNMKFELLLFSCVIQAPGSVATYTWAATNDYFHINLVE